jgi:hypothetical protein
MVNGPAFSAYANASQAVTTGVFTKVAINTEAFDTNSNFASTTNYRFTPTIAGYYQVNGVLKGSATSLTQLNVYLYKNGVEAYQGNAINIPALTSGQTLNISELVYMNGSTDYLELWGFVVGTSPTFAFTSTSSASRFSAAMIRSA